jgi:hypothetical protein
MEARGEIKSYRIDKDLNKPTFYALPNTVALNKHNWEHEYACGQLYVSFCISTNILEWRAWHDKEFRDRGLLYDRLMVCDIGEKIKIILFEVDRGREVYADLEEKIKGYLNLGRTHPDRRFHIIWPTMDSHPDKYTGRPKQTAESRKEGIKRLLEKMKLLSNQFVVGTHKAIVEDPLGPVLEAANRAERLTISTL